MANHSVPNSVEGKWRAQIQSHQRKQAEAHLYHKPCWGLGEAKDNSKPMQVSPCLPEDAGLGLRLGLYTKFTQGSLGLQVDSQWIQESTKCQLSLHDVLQGSLRPRGLALSGGGVTCLPQPIQPLNHTGISLDHRHPIGDTLQGPLFHCSRAAARAAPFRAARSSTWPG